jgi:hypothetical protein
MIGAGMFILVAILFVGLLSRMMKGLER